MLTVEVNPWKPIPQVVSRIERVCLQYNTILDIGPGSNPFSLASKFIDFQKYPELEGKDCADIDLNQDLFPPFVYDVDFVYSRHCLEDLYNPKNFLDEIQLICQAGYIETPSPAHELCRKVDKGRPYLGYYHHFWLIWEEQGVLNLLPKCSSLLEHCIEGYESPLPFGLYDMNTYYLFEDGLKYKIHTLHRDVNGFDRSYIDLVEHAVQQSLKSARKFILGDKGR